MVLAGVPSSGASRLASAADHHSCWLGLLPAERVAARLVTDAVVAPGQGDDLTVLGDAVRADRREDPLVGEPGRCPAAGYAGFARPRRTAGAVGSVTGDAGRGEPIMIAIAGSAVEGDWATPWSARLKMILSVRGGTCALTLRLNLGAAA